VSRRVNVALFGNMGAGKSTIADALTEHGYHRVSFAGPLRNVAALAYGEIDKGRTYFVMDPKCGKERKVTGRQILQGIGQAIKTFDRDFWLKCFIRDTQNYLDTPLVVDDGRFPFEFNALASRGWYTVGIATPDEVRFARIESIRGFAPTEEEKYHESEVEIPGIVTKCDLIVDGTADPYRNAREIIERFTQRSAGRSMHSVWNAGTAPNTS
jgi:hypothetical protein